MESCKISFHSNLKPSFSLSQIDIPSYCWTHLPFRLFIYFFSALINNAGMVCESLFDWNDFALDRRVIEVNLIGTMRMTKALLPYLIKGRGRLINVASLAGKTHLPMCASYAASKHGLFGFADSLRVELYPLDVDVINISPGKKWNEMKWQDKKRKKNSLI